jgi:putative phosphoribosyl transferase
MNAQSQSLVRIKVGEVTLDGDLTLPQHAHGIVLFAHGSGSSRLSPRNRYVAGELNNVGLGTLLMDLLTTEEEELDVQGQFRFDINLLAHRLVGATMWLKKNPATQKLLIGYFGASTGAAAALVAAAKLADQVYAVVSRGGRPDLAMKYLPKVKAPTLLIVGGADNVVIGMNEEAFANLLSEKKLEIVPGATHLFEESGTLETVARLAAEWFKRYLQPK